MACRSDGPVSITGADRKMIRYRSQRPPDTALRGRLRELANERSRFGYRRLFILLRREEGLTLHKQKARRKARWSLGFASRTFGSSMTSSIPGAEHRR